MKPAALLLALTAACGTPATVVDSSPAPLSAPIAAPPSPLPATRSPRPHPMPRAQRHRPAPRPSAHRGAGRLLEVTAYCWTGHRTASGAWPRLGMAAGNRWPFGTRLDVETVGVVTITDRIGHGSELDLYLGGDGCERRARLFGRRLLEVREVHP